MNIEMDFRSDWQNVMIKDMVAEGLRFSTTTSKDLLVIRWFTYLRKKGGQTSMPRRVHKSKEFACPPELIAGLDQLVDKLQKGQDISPYLSKQVDNITNIDGMFNDWGVLHLHLGDRPDPKDNRYVVRTDPLLFLCWKPDDVYLINIYKHGDWTDRSILQTIQDNWPEFIKPFVMSGVIRLSQQYTEKEHQTLRNAGVTVFIELKDQNGDIIVMAPPGLGITSSRDAMQDVRSYDGQLKEIYKIEEYVRDNPELFLKGFERSIADPMQLKLVHENEKWNIVEQSTGSMCELIMK